MEFTFNPDQDNEKEFDSFVGKDIWVRVYSLIEDSHSYIRLDNYTKYGVNYRKVSSSLVDNYYGWYNPDDLGWKCYQDFQDFFYDYHIEYPLDIYTTEELLEFLHTV